MLVKTIARSRWAVNPMADVGVAVRDARAIVSDKIRAMLRAILFDFDGVLIDAEPLHLELFRQVLKEEGLPALSRSDYYDRCLGRDDRDCFHDLLRDAGREPEPGEIPRLVARKAAYYRTRIQAEGFPVFPGATSLVHQARDAGLMLGVVSGALREQIEAGLGQIRLRDAFKTIVASQDVQTSKPDPEGYRLGLERLNALPPLPQRLLHPHEVLAIEDSSAGIEAAAGAGLTTLAVSHTYQASQLGGADHVVGAIGDLDVARLRAFLN